MNGIADDGKEKGNVRTICIQHAHSRVSMPIIHIWLASPKLSNSIPKRQNSTKSNQTKRNETNECVLVVAVLVFSLENSIREFHSSRRRFIFMAIQSNYKHFNVDNLFISFISFALERFYFCVYQE